MDPYDYRQHRGRRHLYSASLPEPGKRRLRSATRTGDKSGTLTGNWIGGLVGSGSTLAANTWTTDSSGSVSSAALRRIDGGRLTTVARGAATILARSADLGRIAVLRADGTVGLYSAGGTLLRTISAAPAKEIALRKDYLVVLTEAKTLAIYDARTGALVRTWPVPGGAARLGVYSGVAVYSVWRRVHALQLTTGKDVVLAAPKRAIVALQIESPGLVYAFDTVKGIREVGNLAFVPFSRVSAALS